MKASSKSTRAFLFVDFPFDIHVMMIHEGEVIGDNSVQVNEII